MQYPLLIGVGIGACRAAIYAKPNVGELAKEIRVQQSTVISGGFRGFKRELAYLRTPVLWTGIALYYPSFNILSCRWTFLGLLA